MSTVFRLAANRNSCKILRNALAKRNFHISLPQRLVVVQCCSATPTGFNQKRYFTGLSVRSFCQQEKERWADLSYEQLNALIESRDIILIDVREPKEIEALGKISDSINIPLSQIKAALQLADGEFSERFKCEKPQKHATNLVFYGLCEVKSSAALEIAHKLGYKKFDQVFLVGQVKGVLAMAPDKFMQKYSKPLNSDKIVFHCQAGVRSMKALLMARELGMDKARHFPGGFEEWAKRQKDSQKKVSSVS